MAVAEACYLCGNKQVPITENQWDLAGQPQDAIIKEDLHKSHRHCLACATHWVSRYS